MGRKWKPRLSEAGSARPFVVAAFDDLEAFFQVRRELEKQFGSIEYEADSITGNVPDSLYEPVARRLCRIVSFARPIGRDEIVDVRRRTIQIESKRQYQGRPLVELDPGYVAEFSVVRTALSEDFHRIYMYGGVFAETLYYFERLAFRPYPYTPEFFRHRDVIAAFNDIRLIHVSG